MLHVVTLHDDPPVFLQSHWRQGVWIGNNELAGQAMYHNPVETSCSPLPVDWYWDKKTPQDEFLIIRAGGIGDLIVLTAMANHLKKTYNAKITLCCNTRFHPAMEGQSAFDGGFMEYPCHVNNIARFNGKIISLELLIENMAVGRKLPMLDAFAYAWDMKIEDKKPTFDVAEDAKNYAMNTWVDNGKAIGIQWRATDSLRSWPESRLKSLLDDAPKDWKFYIFGRAGDCKLPSTERVVNLCGHISFQYAAAIIKHRCDAVLAPDSAITHLCGALDVPCVALYGAFPSWLRTPYYPTVKAIDGDAPCAPCFVHQRPTREPFPGECKNNQGNACSAMASIKADAVIEALKEAMK